jgi:hypothetical protein
VVALQRFSVILTIGRPIAKFSHAPLSALDIAVDAHCALEQWEAALKRIDAIIEINKN